MVQTLSSGKTTQKIVLGFMDLDYSLKTDGPPAVTNKSSVEKTPIMIIGRGPIRCI